MRGAEGTAGAAGVEPASLEAVGGTSAPVESGEASSVGGTSVELDATGGWNAASAAGSPLSGEMAAESGGTSAVTGGASAPLGGVEPAPRRGAAGDGGSSAGAALHHAGRGGEGGRGGTVPTGGLGGLGGAGGVALEGGSGADSAGVGGEAGGAGGCPDGYVGDECGDCVVFVSTSGDDAHSGGSWAHALATVQAGLALAATRVSSGAPTCEVWVARGIYYPTRDTDGSANPPDPRSRTVLLQPEVGLYGGFAGTESTRGERFEYGPRSTLSGDLGVPGDPEDDAYHVVTGADATTIDGFEVVFGNATGAVAPLDRGGGMLNLGVSPTVSRCDFTNNRGLLGGGMYVEYATPVLRETQFAVNEAVWGGGMYSTASELELINTHFVANEADVGAGMYNLGGSVVATGAYLAANWATDGAGIYNDGGTVELIGCVIQGNFVANGGAGMLSQDALLTIIDTQFIGNAADHGGALYNVSSSQSLIRCDFSGNRAEARGAAVYNDSSTTTAEACGFWGNSLDQFAEGGGAVRSTHGSFSTFTNCLFHNNAAPTGGAIFDEASWLYVTNCNFTSNVAFGEDALGAALAYDTSILVITNSIFWHNVPTADAIANRGSGDVAYLTYCDVEDGCTVVDACTQSDVGNVAADPLFIISGIDERLSWQSPCIDAADGGVAPSTDRGGAPRVDIPGVGHDAENFADVGAYEYTP